MPTKRTLSTLAMACAPLLTACGSESQMVSAIQDTLNVLRETNPTSAAACLPLPPHDALLRDPKGDPVPVFVQSGPGAATLSAMSAHALLKPSAPSAGGLARLTLSEEGIKYLHRSGHPRVPPSWNWSLCTGNMKVTSIETYTKPSEIFDQTLTSVTYRYAIEGAADWARDARVQALHPRFARHFQKPVSSMDLVQTNKGWRSIYMLQRENGKVQ
jgi:hypothetical protein